MFCRNCFANLPDGTEVCPKCNASLAKESPAEEAEKKQDNTSGLDSRDAVSSAPLLTDNQRMDKKPSAGLIIISGLAGAILVFLALVIYQKIDFKPAAPKGSLTADKASDDQPAPSAKAAVTLPRMNEDPLKGVNTADPAIQKHLQDSKDYILNGKFQNAVESLRMVLEKYPENQDIKKAISATYGLIAAKKIETGNYQDAVEGFKNAIRYFNEDPKLYLGMGSAYLQLNKGAEAENALNSAINIDPNLSEAYYLLAELYYYKNDDVAKAITYLEKVLSIEPSNQKARYLLSKTKREKDTNEKFTKEIASHFTIRFEGPEEREKGRLVISILEDAYREIGRELSAYPDAEVIVYIYTKQQFRNVTRSPSWAGALYDGKIRIPISGYKDDLIQLKKNLYHEYTHALVRSIVKEGRCPTWLNEGLAQHFEDKEQSDYRREMIKALQRNKVAIPMRNLEGSFMGFSSAQSHVAYSVSLAIVEFMVDRYGMHKVKSVLEELGKNKTIDEAMRDGLSIPYEVFQKEWQSDFERGRG